MFKNNKTEKRLLSKLISALEPSTFDSAKVYNELCLKTRNCLVCEKENANKASCSTVLVEFKFTVKNFFFLWIPLTWSLPHLRHDGTDRGTVQKKKKRSFEIDFSIFPPSLGENTSLGNGLSCVGVHTQVIIERHVCMQATVKVAAGFMLASISSKPSSEKQK